jgi:transposase
MPKKLSQKEVAKRLIRLRNLEQLHRISKQMRNKKDELIAAQAEQLDKFEALVIKQQEFIETQAIRIAELEAMVFGKKKRPPTGGTPVAPEPTAATKQVRPKASYRRPLPPATAITDEVAMPLPDHCQCGGELQNVTTHDRYQEDIPLPELTPGYQAKLITKYVISRGVCAACGKATSGKDLGGQAVTLGPNAGLLICHLVTIMGMSYQQVTNLLLSLYGLHASDGEIAKILASQHQAWLPAYEQLKAEIRAAPAVHADETPWPIQSLDGYGYAWNLSDAASPKVCFALENSRGRVHAKNLFGEQFVGVRISDDYGGYRTLPGIQQLCWAHLYRCIRDLRYNDNLPEEQLPDVTWWYEQFAGIYQALRQCLDESYERSVRETQATELWQQLLALLPTTPDEPVKLTKLKAQLKRAGQAKLFACLIYDTPCDNNRAERDLRQLVLKRKRSFGSQTQKGAQALATVLSLCTTTWRTQPTGYFRALAQLG